MIPTEPRERLSVTAERVDDFNTRRYLVTVTFTVPADTAAEAVEIASAAVAGLT